MEEAVAYGFIAGSLMFSVMISLVMLVLLVIARWRVFTKAGEAGWKSLVPIYSDYTLYDIVWDTHSFFIYLGCMIVMSISMSMSGNYALVNGQVVLTGQGNIALDILTFISSLGVLYFTIACALKTARAFGKSTGFAIGLMLLPSIFTLILGFGSDTYLGPQN